MKRPKNPYREGTVVWSLMEGDWDGLTVRQIAEVLDNSRFAIYSYLSKIRKDTGYSVPHASGRKEKG